MDYEDYEDYFESYEDDEIYGACSYEYDPNYSDDEDEYTNY